VLVDKGAVDALTRRGTSLLPVGVVAVEGAFAPGDAIEVIDAEDRTPVGKGIAAMGADEVRLVRGQRSDSVRERLPGGSDEVVHRDQFVLADEGR
jgi:glutamate 5-kinase